MTTTDGTATGLTVSTVCTAVIAITDNGLVPVHRGPCPEHITPALITEMRGWVADCEWADVGDVAEVSDVQVIRGVARHYVGGIEAFATDCCM